MSQDPKILFVHHFALTRVTGVRAVLSDLLRWIPALRPGAGVAFESYDSHHNVGRFVDSLSGRYGDATCVVGVNVHVDFGLDYTIGLLDWCSRSGTPVHLYVHDYWPKHRALLASLVVRYHCGLLASSQYIRDLMHADGFEVVLVQVGVPLGNVERGMPPARTAWPTVVGSVGRLVPRKRFTDIVAAFGRAGLPGRAQLRLRLVASCVYGVEEDDLLLADITREGRVHGLGPSMWIDRTPTKTSDYRGYDVYVCASSYEGFSMTPIEAAYSGCPPLMSDIPAHRAIAEALFPGRADAYLFPIGEIEALARLMADELATGCRATYLLSRLDDVRKVVESRWSPRSTAEAIIRVAVGDAPRDRGFDRPVAVAGPVRLAAPTPPATAGLEAGDTR